MRKTLEGYDVESLLWDLKTISIFFPEPLEITVPGFKTEFVGGGWGGFSWTFFQRGFGCTACGNCCRAPKSGDFSRRSWFWFDVQDRPAGESIPVNVGVGRGTLPLHLHPNSNSRACDFLSYDRDWVRPDETYVGQRIDLVQNVDGLVPQQFCTIHNEGLKPLHCLWSPGAETYPTGKSKTFLLSRRLPGRNWAWPMCPVDVTKYEIRKEDQELDRKILHMLADSIRHLPGCRIDDAIDIWESVTAEGVTPTESIFFRNFFV